MTKNYYFKIKTWNIKTVKGIRFFNFLAIGQKPNNLLHIGKLLYDGAFLFRTTMYYGNIEQLKTFYNLNRNILSIIDDNGCEVVWDDFVQVFLMASKKYESSLTSEDYIYIDDYGYLFSTVDFK